MKALTEVAHKEEEIKSKMSDSIQKMMEKTIVVPHDCDCEGAHNHHQYHIEEGGSIEKLKAPDSGELEGGTKVENAAVTPEKDDNIVKL